MLGFQCGKNYCFVGVAVLIVEHSTPSHIYYTGPFEGGGGVNFTCITFIACHHSLHVCEPVICISKWPDIRGSNVRNLSVAYFLIIHFTSSSLIYCHLYRQQTQHDQACRVGCPKQGELRMAASRTSLWTEHKRLGQLQE